ncbi:MAG: hypothetical protein V1826_00325 [bacterium]
MQLTFVVPSMIITWKGGGHANEPYVATIQDPDWFGSDRPHQVYLNGAERQVLEQEIPDRRTGVARSFVISDQHPDLLTINRLVQKGLLRQTEEEVASPAGRQLTLASPIAA